jgi:membrane protein YdbS with pleckstrin-like domain
MYEQRGVQVVSAVEGQATQLAPMLPKVLIVPEVRFAEWLYTVSKVAAVHH